MKRHQQRLCGPVTLRAPRRVEHRLVDHRTQRVSGRENVLGRNLGARRALLECANLVNGLAAQALDVCVRDLAAQATGEREQGHRGLHKWKGAYGSKLAQGRGRLGRRVQRCRRGAR